jgi:glycine/D-amino acid oxidase-like deaminating enzyme
VMPTLGGPVVVRGASERAGFRAVPLVGAVRHTLDAADLYPPLADGRVVALHAGLTPQTPDGLPVLGQFSQVTGLMAAIEVGEYGALLAPLMADVVAAELLSIAVPFDLAPFRPDRWS